jgi:F0F1-type ATP synthase delta subunit
MSETELVLPVALVNRTDAGRLLREVVAVNEFLDQAAIRQPGTQGTLPKTSRLMTEMVQANGLNMLHEEDRAKLQSFLNALIEHAPQLHMSFSAEPSVVFMQKLTDYVRQNIHPQALLQVGLQPTIGAGFMLRTTNKYYDFSLRSVLKAKHDVLMHNIRSIQSADTQAAVKEEAAV